MNEKYLPLAACALVRNKDGKVLAVSRKHDPNDFGLPGGKQETGEKLEQTATRETLEETGYKLTNLQFVFGCECVGEVTYWVATYTADLADETAKPIESSEGKVAWVDAKELTKGCFGEYNKKLFDHADIKYD